MTTHHKCVEVSRNRHVSQPGDDNERSGRHAGMQAHIVLLHRPVRGLMSLLASLPLYRTQGAGVLSEFHCS